MNPILLAIIAVTAIGIICAIVLTIASKVMHVKVDERFPIIRGILPGANCGACGYAGCDGYAKALLEDGAKTNLCTPGADAVSRQLSEALGLEYEDVVEQVAVIHCWGDMAATQDKMDYQGIESCAAARLLFGGKGQCTFGCIGLGDCVGVCPSDAICIENGIAHIDTRKCTGCGLCTKTCPNHLINLMPDVARVIVTCSNTEKGAVVRKKCTHGCIACKRCEKECPEGAIAVVNNLATIDYDKCTSCGKCVAVCPTKCLKFSDFSGAHRT